MSNDFLRLCRIVKGPDGEGKTHQAERNEGRPFQQHNRRCAGTEQAKTQHVDLPGHRIDSRHRLKPSGQFRQGIEHTAKEHQKDVGCARKRVEGIHPVQADSKNTQQEKPSGCCRHNNDCSQGQEFPADTDTHHENAKGNGKKCSKHAQQHIETDFADEKLAASNRISQQLEKDTGILVHEKAPCRVHRNAKGRHRDHTRQQIGCVIKRLAIHDKRRGQRALEAYAKQRQVGYRDEYVPKNKSDIGDPLAPIPIDNSSDFPHTVSFTRAMKISSRSAPRISKCVMGTDREMSASSPRSDASLPRNSISTDFPSALNSTGMSASSRPMRSPSMPANDRFTRNICSESRRRSCSVPDAKVRPRSMIRIVSHSCSASLRTCVVSSTVRPLRASSRMRSITRLFMKGSMPVVASSRKITGESSIKILATWTRRLVPMLKS